MIASLLPDCVVVREGRITDGDGGLSADEERHVRLAVPKRRREFRAGRLCARAALDALGVRTDTLRVNPDRTPAWPSGVVGSISHCDMHCAAAVAWRSDIGGIGIDVEHPHAFEPDVLRLVCTPHELGQMPRQSLDQSLFATVIFSAKEAFYKCQYPITRAWLGFHDVEVELDERAHCFHLTLCADVDALPKRATFTGRYGVGDGIIGSAITMMPER